MTAVVLGGVSFAGGSGSMLGAMMGVIIIGVLNNGMQLIGMDSNMINCVKGIVLLIAIGIDSVQRTGKRQRKSDLQNYRPGMRAVLPFRVFFETRRNFYGNLSTHCFRNRIPYLVH